MKSLYESILDDEDVLIDKTKKLANNWLLSLKFAMLNNDDDEYIEKIINQDAVKNEISKIFYKFDGRMKWVAGKYNGQFKSNYCILKDTKARSKYHSKSVISFMLWDSNDEKITINVPNIYELSKTTSKNVKPSELLKFKQRLLELGAEYSKTGTGKVREDVLEI
jgi:hypothetical protein